MKITPDKRAAACDGKRSFATYSDAERITKRHGRDYARRAYHCPVCHKFHIGSTGGKPVRLKPILDDLDDYGLSR